MLRAVLTFLGNRFRKYLERQVEAAHEAALKLDVKDNLVRMLMPPVPLSKVATKEQELDFVEHRSPTYIPPMTDGVVEETLLAIHNANKPEPFDAAKIAEICLNCAVAYLLRRDGEEWVLDFSRITLFPFRPLTVAQFRFDLERNTFSVIDVGGRTHSPGDPTWETAITHVMAWTTIGVPSGAHNWVHFALPDVAASAHERMAQGDTNVARLLEPHLRFTNRINYQALWIQRGSTNAPTLRKAMVPWISMPYYPDQFRGGILRNTQRHYENLPQHFELPRSLDARVPYFAFLREYYEVVERFATALDPALEEDAWNEFAQLVDRELPGFAAIPRVKALAVLIWQVGVVHICDHLTFYPYALAHGFMKVPPSLFTPFTQRDVSRHDRWKTRSFARTWVNFNPTPGLDQRLINIDAYGFEPGGCASNAAQQFKTDLLDVDARLSAEGRALVPAERMIQSICF
ncbi:MAG TPA: hypothetical protein VMW62_10615 [Chloroflexota bacterium]|nr:hypothetical protein [Chloroflexota bacterium]